MEKADTQKPVLIFCHMGLSSFVQTDLDLLAGHFDITPFCYPLRKNFTAKIYTAFRAFIHAFRHVPGADSVYTYFAGFHCFPHILLASLLGKRIVMTAGGFDAASIPSLQYGVFYRKNFLQSIVRLEYRLAHRIAVVDPSLIFNVNTYAAGGGSGYTSGILAFCPSVAEKLCVVPGCADGNFWTMPDKKSVRSGVIFVAVINRWSTFLAKGGEIILGLASDMPDIQFTLAGIQEDVQNIIKSKDLSNIRLMPFLDQNQLRKEYQTHSVFLLPSYTEGLPNVLCEAMLCGCIPAVSEVNGMPAAVGATGFVVSKPDVNLWKQAVQQALQANHSLREAGRDHILAHYSPQIRQQKLMGLLKTVQ